MSFVASGLLSFVIFSLVDFSVVRNVSLTYLARSDSFSTSNELKCLTIAANIIYI